MSAPPAAATPGTSPKRRRGARWPFVLTALMLGVVLAAVAIEVAVRVLWTPPLPEFQQAGMYEAAADGGIALLPGYRGTLDVTLGQTAGRTTQVAINGLGMRGPDVGAKAAGERRVLVVGDSLVFGYGVEAHETLPAALERALRAAGAPCTVGNGGVPGFGSRQAVAQMARLDAPFGADAFVVCGYLGNDARDDLVQAQAVFAGLKFDGSMARLVESSWRFRLAIRSRAALMVELWLWNHWPERSVQPLLAQFPDELLATRGLPGTPPDHALAFAGLFLDAVDEGRQWDPGAPPILPRVHENLRASLRRAKELAGERPLAFVVLPTAWQVVEPMRIEKLRELQLDPEQFARGLAQQRWTAIARELGIMAWDATPILASVPRDAQRALFIEDGGHLSPRGAELLAAWLAAELAPKLR